MSEPRSYFFAPPFGAAFFCCAFCLFVFCVFFGLLSPTSHLLDEVLRLSPEHYGVQDITRLVGFDATRVAARPPTPVRHRGHDD